MAWQTGELFPHGEAHTQIVGREYRRSGSCGGENRRKKEERANGRSAGEEKAKPLLTVLITVDCLYIIPNHALFHSIVSFHFRNQTFDHVTRT